VTSRRGSHLTASASVAAVVASIVVLNVLPAFAQTVVTVRDEFRAVSYSGNDGSATFSGPWAERGESDGPNAGSVRVVTDVRCAGGAGNCLRLGSDGGDLEPLAVDRAVDLDGADAATLRFTWRRDSQGQVNGAVRVRVSANGGSSWSTLSTIAIAGSQGSSSAVFDISAWASGSTVIRFDGLGTVVTGYILLDDVEVRAEIAASSTTTTTAPSSTTTTSTVPGATTTTIPPGPTTTTTSPFPGTTTTTVPGGSTTTTSPGDTTSTTSTTSTTEPGATSSTTSIPGATTSTTPAGGDTSTTTPGSATTTDPELDGSALVPSTTDANGGDANSTSGDAGSGGADSSTGSTGDGSGGSVGSTDAAAPDQPMDASDTSSGPIVLVSAQLIVLGLLGAALLRIGVGGGASGNGS
jgi:hypothetical protein